MSSLLLIGPMTNKKDPSKTGGIIVLFEDLLVQCTNMGIEYKVIDTNKANYQNKVFAFISIFSAFLKKISKSSHISLHGTANDYLMIAPFVIFFSKLFRKEVSLRKFAGNFDTVYDDSPVWKKKVFQYVLKKSDYNFFETKYLLKKFKTLNNKTYWFPNVRTKPVLKREGQYEKKFIFLGQISEEKGILELIEASKLLDDSYAIDLYGTLVGEMQNIDYSLYHVSYCGELSHEDVYKTLIKYDVLLLPSYREGYPGVIIEALSVGLPIIATNLKGIQEMVDEKCSVLIEPKNVNQLKEAILSFTDENYGEKSKLALKQFENFDSKVQTKLFFERIGVLC